MSLLLHYYIITLILTKELVMATDHCDVYHFKSPFYPGESCEEIYTNNPESHDRSGYYWILDGPRKVYCGMTYTGSSCEDIYNNNPETGDKSGYYRINSDQWIYCNMTAIAADFIPTCAGVGGGWRRIANVDITTGGDCPSGWSKETHSSVSYCRTLNEDNICSSANFSTNGHGYQKVCGRARGYQLGHTAAFLSYYNGGSLDTMYMNGLSITYSSNPRKHIWSFTAGVSDNLTSYRGNCPCVAFTPPPFVGGDYYCESGTANISQNGEYYFDDPLWDGLDCAGNTCCDDSTQPWFYRDLNDTITSDLEMRLCNPSRDGRKGVLIVQLEVYIQ